MTMMDLTTTFNGAKTGKKKKINGTKTKTKTATAKIKQGSPADGETQYAQ